MRPVTLSPLHNTDHANGTARICMADIEIEADVGPLPSPMYVVGNAPRRPMLAMMVPPQFRRPERTP